MTLKFCLFKLSLILAKVSEEKHKVHFRSACSKLYFVLNAQHEIQICLGTLMCTSSEKRISVIPVTIDSSLMKRPEDRKPS